MTVPDCKFSVQFKSYFILRSTCVIWPLYSKLANKEDVLELWMGQILFLGQVLGINIWYNIKHVGCLWYNGALLLN